MTTDRLGALRDSYARAMTARIDPPDDRLRAAFATVPREDFLPPPPWTLAGDGFGPSRTSDPTDLYRDVLVALDAAKGLNNGSPALQARMLHLLAPNPGETVLHLGAGGGYYSAILAELVGPAGRVLAVEYDAALARAAAAHLRPWPHASVVQGDAAAYPRAPVDRIYVNFAVADLPEPWLVHLAKGGRLVLPLGVPEPDAVGPDAMGSARAAVLVVTRTGQGFAARFDVAVSFICAEGPAAGDPALRRALFAAFGRDRLGEVRGLHRGPLPAPRAWFGTPRWSLGYDAP